MKLHLIIVYLLTDIYRYTIAMTSLVNLPKEEMPSLIPKACVMERAYKMLGYSCTHLDLTEIPQNLKSGVEVFDVSTNRIRRLSPDSFARYTSLKFLYLYDNLINVIEKDTFSQLTLLEAIDLSTNGIRSIPPELFQLPRLRNLYVNDNQLITLDDDLKMIDKPIRAPLEYLNIAKNSLKHIPDFGVLPELWRLNISSNPLVDVIPQEFSPYCNLNTIDLNDTQIPPCTCQAIAFYLRNHGIKTKNGFNCDTTAQDLIYCTDLTNSTLEAPSFYECTSLKKIQQKSHESKVTWISISAGLLSFFVLFIGILYALHRRNVRQTKKMEHMTKIKLKHIHQTEENGNREILLGHEKT